MRDRSQELRNLLLLKSLAYTSSRSYTVVSMIFVGQMVGFVAAGLLCSKLIDRYGLGKVIAMGAIIQAAGYVFLIPAWSFPVMPVCYAILVSQCITDASVTFEVREIARSRAHSALDSDCTGLRYGATRRD